jgi:hypothetical protein
MTDLFNTIKKMYSAKQILKDLDDQKDDQDGDFKITPSQYLAEYTKKAKKFCELSISSHEHNTFSEDHMTTLSNTGFYVLGNTLRCITSTFDRPHTMVEVGAGTGIGITYILPGLFGDEYPESCVKFTVKNTEKKAKIDRYIYTDPFNELSDCPSKYSTKIKIQKKKADIFNVICSIKNDDTINDALLLVVCPPPIHEDRSHKCSESLGKQLVSTDVIALVESVNCTKIKHVMIVRYDDGGRSDLDGTLDFFSYHVPLLKQFGKWSLKQKYCIDTYGNGYDYFNRSLFWFTRM